MGLSGEGMAYAYGPGPGYAWAALHPGGPPSECHVEFSLRNFHAM